MPSFQIYSGGKYFITEYKKEAFENIDSSHEGDSFTRVWFCVSILKLKYLLLVSPFLVLRHYPSKKFSVFIDKYCNFREKKKQLESSLQFATCVNGKINLIYKKHHETGIKIHLLK